MLDLIILLFVGALFVAPIALLVVFVQWRAKARRARLEGPWGALAQRYVKTVPSLPFLVIHGADGRRVATLHGADLAALDAALAKAGAQ